MCLALYGPRESTNVKTFCTLLSFFRRWKKLKCNYYTFLTVVQMAKVGALMMPGKNDFLQHFQKNAAN